MLHAFCELYYTGHEFDEGEIIFMPDQQHQYYLEACRVWGQYKEKFRPDEWGEILAIEEVIDSPEVADLLGVPKYTTKADVVCRLGERECSNFRDHFKCKFDIEPGVYGVDHKFLKSTPSNLGYKYPNSLQFVGYQLAWNLTHPEQPLSGWITNITIKTKETKHFRMFIPPPNAGEIKALRNNLRYWNFIKENYPTQTNAQEDYCFGFIEPCYWWTNGICDRGSEQFAETDKLVQLAKAVTTRIPGMNATGDWANATITGDVHSEE